VYLLVIKNSTETIPEHFHGYLWRLMVICYLNKSDMPGKTYKLATYGTDGRLFATEVSANFKVT